MIAMSTELESLMKSVNEQFQSLLHQFEMLDPEAQKSLMERCPFFEGLDDKATRQNLQIRTASFLGWIEGNPEFFSEAERRARDNDARNNQPQ
jgi:hypothetical protein